MPAQGGDAHDKERHEHPEAARGGEPDPDLLLDEVVWRDKAQFDEGSGTADLLPELPARILCAAAAPCLLTPNP